MLSFLELHLGCQWQLGEAEPMTQTSMLAFKECRGTGTVGELP